MTLRVRNADGAEFTAQPIEKPALGMEASSASGPMRTLNKRRAAKPAVYFWSSASPGAGGATT